MPTITELKNYFNYNYAGILQECDEFGHFVGIKIFKPYHTVSFNDDT